MSKRDKWNKTTAMKRYNIQCVQLQVQTAFYFQFLYELHSDSEYHLSIDFFLWQCQILFTLVHCQLTKMSIIWQLSQKAEKFLHDLKQSGNHMKAVHNLVYRKSANDYFWLGYSAWWVTILSEIHKSSLLQIFMKFRIVSIIQLPPTNYLLHEFSFKPSSKGDSALLVPVWTMYMIKYHKSLNILFFPWSRNLQYYTQYFT